MFVVGAPKCGTTSMYRTLRQHPEVVVSTDKEPRFFELHWDRGLAWYEDHCFPEAGPGSVYVEASPMYLSLPYVPERLHDCYPGARLIAMIRDPLRRAESAWWMHHSAGRERLDFDQALRRNLEAMDAGIDFSGKAGELLWRRNVEMIEERHEVVFGTYLEASLYAAGLRRFLACFPAEQLHVVILDELKERPHEVVEGIERFMGVEPAIGELGGRSDNQAIDPRWSGLVRAVAPLKKAGLLPRPVIEAGRKVLTGGRGTRGIQDPGLRKRVVGLLQRDLAELQEMIPGVQVPEGWLAESGS